jgi:hypothetical protein
LAGELALLSGLISVVFGLNAVDHNWVWISYAWLAAFFTSLLIGFPAFCFLERAKPNALHLTLATSASVGLALTALIACVYSFGRGGLDPAFSTTAMKRGVVKIAFYGPDKSPAIVGGENYYHADFHCVIMQMQGADSPTGPWTSYASSQDCSIFVVWKRPIRHPTYTITLDGNKILMNPGEDKPYITSIRLKSLPMVGLLEIFADAKND